MADTTTVVEGRVKFRDGKKWKQRWCVLKKPSPVADRLQVLLYKDVKDAIRDGRKPKSTFFVENYYGLVSGFSHDKENTVMAVLCQKQVSLFAFETLDLMIQFEIKIRHSLGEEHQFPVTVVKVPPNSRLPLDKVTLMIQGQRFCLVAHVPPRVLQAWHISDLRRFGAVDGKFCFEGGSRCGKGSGVHAVQSDQSEDLANLVRLGSLGRTPTSLRNAPNKREGAPACPWRDSLEQQALHAGPLIVSVEDVRQAAEADGGDSIVSLESLDAISICSDDTIPCGPGTTTLRPRSGREYQVVERRRTPSDSCASSPHTPQTPQTPYSPSSVAYVFTFDSPSTSGASAACPCPHVESNSACTCPHTPRSHLPSVSSEVPTPHPSQVPKSPGLLPIEQAEPQLNYAVIDLTSVPKDKVKKRHKVQRAVTIEYAKIDMVATRAVQKAAQHREDTLRRSHSAVCGSHSGTSSLRKNSVHLQSRHERRTLSTSVASTSGTQRETRPSTSSLEPS